MKKSLRLDLALQGGGAHGAFTWGVLDRLLDEPDILISGISGTSAGALNGAMLISGWVQGGDCGGPLSRLHAKEKLRHFWESVGEMGALLAPFRAGSSSWPGSGWNSAASNYDFFDLMTRMWSPYQLNPFNLNPLRAVLTRLLDLDTLHGNKDVSLFVTATNVHTGEPKVFECHDLSIDALLASACLPFLFQAVEIDGVPYWDGGYVGNPALWPLIYHQGSDDILLVQINPLQRLTTPETASDIISRLNEITFNASLMGELRAIEFVQRLMSERRLDPDHYRDLRMHRIAMAHTADDLNAASKLNADTQFILELHRRGVAACDEWLKKHRKDLGKRETLDIRETFLRKSETQAPTDAPMHQLGKKRGQPAVAKTAKAAQAAVDAKTTKTTQTIKKTKVSKSPKRSSTSRTNPSFSTPKTPALKSSKASKPTKSSRSSKSS